jgi:hypothetical protein
LTDTAELLNDAEEAQRLILDGRQSTIWTALPGIVQKVDWSTMTCEVQPAVQGSVQDSSGNVTRVNYPLLLDVPIVFPQAGGFALTLPLAAGSEVLVVWACRCIDAWWQLGGVQAPIEARMHDLSDGFAIPGPVSKPNVIADISTTGAQLRKIDGTAYLEISADGGIKAVAAAGKALAVTGNLTVSGTVVATGEVTGNGIPLSTHTHPVTTAPGTTGAPT